MDPVGKMLELVGDGQPRRKGEHRGTVSAVGGTVDVQLDGSDGLTMCASWTCECKAGDRVLVSIDPGDHSATVVDNFTDISAGAESVDAVDGRVDELAGTVDADREASEAAVKAVVDALDAMGRDKDASIKAAKDAADAAQEDADAAMKAAEAAQATAGATGQYFFHDSNGVHVSTTSGSATGTSNALLNSSGLLFRAASRLLAQLTTSALAFYDGAGNAASNIVAQFTSTSARIGKESGGNVVANATAVLLRKATSVIAQLSAGGVAFYDGEGDAASNIVAQYTPTSQRIGKSGGGNIVVNPASILFNYGGNPLAQMSGSALTFYDGEGSAEANTTAQYGKDLVRIGKLNEPHAEIDSSGIVYSVGESTTGIRGTTQVKMYPGGFTVGVKPKAGSFSFVNYATVGSSNASFNGDLFVGGDVDANGYSLTTASGASAAAASGVTFSVNSVKRVGPVAYLNLFFKVPSSMYGSEVRVATIPEGYRPTAATRGALGHTSKATATDSEYFYLAPDGALYVNTSASGNLVCASYPVV